jgi:uncharacterized glyoxalase superfamily protein PhnB
MSKGSSADAARQTVTPHLVVRDAAAASAWYQLALGAEERGRIPVPGGGSCRSSSASATPP